MSPHSDWMNTHHGVLDDLRELQKKHQVKAHQLAQRGHGVWASGVLFGIEIGQNRIAEYRTRSLGELNAFLDHWERISRLQEVSRITPATRGIDFGIRMVIVRVRRFLQASAPPEFPWPKSS